jgi:hypothetical protein
VSDCTIHNLLLAYYHVNHQQRNETRQTPVSGASIIVAAIMAMHALWSNKTLTQNTLPMTRTAQEYSTAKQGAQEATLLQEQRSNNACTAVMEPEKKQETGTECCS